MTSTNTTPAMSETETIFARQIRADRVEAEIDAQGDGWAYARFADHCYGYPVVCGEIAKFPTQQYW